MAIFSSGAFGLRNFRLLCNVLNVEIWWQNDWPVHQLWPPSGGKQRTELDVVFFHGFQLTANDTWDAWSSTWTQRGHGDVCWPREWLPFDLGEAVRIFSVSYNADVVTSPHDHVSGIAHNVLQNLMNPRYEWHHPIVLIGHSFGGLVLKSLVVKLERASTVRNPTNMWEKTQLQRVKAFLSNVRGVAFYAVPHAGMNISEYLNKLKRAGEPPGILDNIQPQQKDMEQLSVDFDGIVSANGVSIYSFCEGRPMEQVGILVHDCSARRSAANNFYKVEDADHMEVCKPPSRDHPSYDLLLQFVITCREEGRCDQPSQEFYDMPQSTFGLESYVGRVEMLVTSEARDGDPLYVRVSGMGGVGKTLLLQRVYCSPNVRGHFKGAKFIWCTVGQTPDVMALYRTLSAELGLKPEENLNREAYKRKLHYQFGQERVFLVLDDVWKDEAFDSLNFAKGKGSVTLLSTRNLYLVERATLHVRQVHMKPLSKEDSWSLFCVHAFRPPSDVPSELKDSAEAMAEECGGLPLALKVIGSAMFRKTLPGEWKFHLKKLTESRMHEPSVVGELYTPLKLGFDCLSDDDRRLQRCFIFFAAFPEDFAISFTKILWHWVGEGLVPENVGDDPGEDARSLLNKLLQRCFIEKEVVSNADDYMMYKIHHARKVVSNEDSSMMYKVHDVMRDLAVFIVAGGITPAKRSYLYRAGQNLEAFPQEWMVPSEAWSLSLRGNKLRSLPPSFHAPRLVCLLLGNNHIDSLPSGFLRNFRELRVLDLRRGNFSNLPEELGDLEHLVCLDLEYCEKLKLLPDAVGKLRMLKYLDVSSCKNLEYVPSGIVGLTSLEVLNTTDSDGLRWVDYSPSCMASVEDICGFQHLTELHIFGEIVTGKLPDSISALTNLKVLSLGLANVNILPAEMGYWFKHLQELRLFMANISFTQLPNSFTSCGGFPALKTLTMYLCIGFTKFPEVETGAFPSLQTLCIELCMFLESLPLSLELLPNLSKLRLVDASSTLEEGCRTNCEKSAIWKKLNIQYFKDY